ncbi:hypothetical protein KVF89_26595 [Nocardioides carbamazepini]|uniref:PaaX family transcriptional regulator n=1 Tax=Nocardioides carbamazepini TaxID=2854259 RepID=UPI002149C9E7|nr:PaaX family transcriptional regulator C-terminal domain-containing protein [Nocardioides carbamazepini]MCR1786129.1 hypothetical protein [Nocardioides carbamazepini]
MKARSIVFDLFGDYLRYRGEEVRLRTLVGLLAHFDVTESTTRVVMGRLRKEGWFEARTIGRETAYALTAESRATLDEGRARIFGRNVEPWDGTWHMAIYTVPESSRELRDTLRKQLTWLGYGPLASSTWISSRDQESHVLERFGDDKELQLDFFTCQSGSRVRDRELVERCWDLEGLGRDYADFLARHRTTAAALRAEPLSPEAALVARTRLIHEYRKFPFRDPDLPGELLPASWPGAAAYDLFMELHGSLGAGAEEAVDATISSTTK